MIQKSEMKLPQDLMARPGGKFRFVFLPKAILTQHNTPNASGAVHTYTHIPLFSLKPLTQPDQVVMGDVSLPVFHTLGEEYKTQWKGEECHTALHPTAYDILRK